MLLRTQIERKQPYIKHSPIPGQVPREVRDTGDYLIEVKSHVAEAEHEALSHLPYSGLRTFGQIFIFLSVMGVAANMIEHWFPRETTPLLIDTAPIIRAFKTEVVKNATEELLEGGVTPIIHDPQIMQLQVTLFRMN
jgi:hypothetical protein